MIGWGIVFFTAHNCFLINTREQFSYICPMKDYFEIKFTLADKSYEAQVWPDEDENDQVFCQVTFHTTGGPAHQHLIFIEQNNTGEWTQKTGFDEDEEKMNADFIAAMGTRINEEL